MILCTKIIETPIGALLAAANDEGVFLLDFLDRKGGIDKVKDRIAKQLKAIFVEKEHPILSKLQKQLVEFFEKTRTSFDLPIQFSCSDFQQQVLTRVALIPYGQTLSYQQLARQLNMPTAIRAVAQANAQNHLAILIPCHRVIASNGLLTGYSGGVEAKRKLLSLENGQADSPIQSLLF